LKKYQKSKILNEGKTKTIWSVKDNSALIIIENKKDITAFDDPQFTKRFELKAKYATTTTCRVFELLKREGIPVAYLEQLSPTEFLAPKCEMIPLEVVARRYAVGSYLKRMPKFSQPDGQPPFRFEELYTELFLKTTKGQLVGKDGKILVGGLDAKKGEEDPLFANPKESEWRLLHPKKAASDPECGLKKIILASDVVNNPEAVSQMQNILKQCF